MNAKQVENIANMVMANLSGGVAPMGCGAVSNTEAFESGPVFACSGGYECGGVAAFSCIEAFTCNNDFECPFRFGPSSCKVQFTCEVVFNDNRCADVPLFDLPPGCNDVGGVYYPPGA